MLEDMPAAALVKEERGSSTSMESSSSRGVLQRKSNSSRIGLSPNHAIIIRQTNDEQIATGRIY